MFTLEDDRDMIIFCLPDCAFCKAEGKRLEEFDVCPLYKYDEFGDECVPGLCEYYTEDWDGEFIGKEEE